MFDVKPAQAALENSPGALADDEEHPKKKTKDEMPTPSWSRLSLSEAGAGKNLQT